MDGMHARMDGVKSADMKERQWRRTRYRSVGIYCNNCTCILLGSLLVTNGTYRRVVLGGDGDVGGKVLYLLGI